jgi:hypothetical protein
MFWRNFKAGFMRLVLIIPDGRQDKERCVPRAAKDEKESGLLGPQIRGLGGRRQWTGRRPLLERIEALAVRRRQLLHHHLLQNRKRSNLLVHGTSPQQPTQTRLHGWSREHPLAHNRWRRSTKRPVHHHRRLKLCTLICHHSYLV